MKASSLPAFWRDFFWQAKPFFQAILLVSLFVFCGNAFAGGSGISHPEDLSRTFFSAPEFVPNGKEEELVVTVNVVTKNQFLLGEKVWLMEHELEKHWHRPQYGEKMTAWGSCSVVVQKLNYKLNCYADINLSIRFNADDVKARPEDIVEEIKKFSQDVFEVNVYKNQI